ncbi:myotubularin-related protein 4 isoform X2 [Harmonia axyridis]|uniref:myotubularin-related protein 4 isoform X2 n=1 Tax=Harmonia axyridis TaxID=115357 RepID=UPI001E2786D7|nr:myotubularin-related protein 4 isoform X2 [Harmonia axyridis]
MDSTDQPNSICQVERIEMYQLPPSDPKLSLPFNLLEGEAVEHHGTSRDGLILITNYRLYLQIARNHHHVPLGLIETVEQKELFYVYIGCKDCRTYKCTFENNDSCLEWYDKLLKAAEPPKQLNQLFAFFHFAHFRANDDRVQKPYCFDLNSFTIEMDRLQFEKSLWRISKVNVNYEVCPSYPPYLLVPKDIDDEELKKVAKFRSSQRIPAVVWRHTKNGAVVARCSQPEVGWFGWRGEEDEKLLQLISKSIDNTKQEKKVLILDARSYAIAVANRARGGGCECPEYYSNCEIQFMNLANIHSIRKSFQALRLLCTSSTDQTWHSQLENTKWLQHMSGLMKAAVTLVTAVDSDARSVMVHCSDGWDRTPQIVALGELLLDPYYRTVDGFRVLIEREWLAFGHKFADRCGHSTGSEDLNERCPVFLQWLDCVHQLLKQFPCDFEFSEAYLVKLAQHIYSNLFGTFLCNTLQDRLKIVNNRTFSVWEFLNSPRFKNHLYEPSGNFTMPKVIWPLTNVRDLYLWREVYLGTMEANFRTDCGSESCPGPPDILAYHMTKTRSYNDLAAMSDCYQGHFRRSSDPSLNIEKKLNSVSLQEGQEPTHIHENGVLTLNRTSELEDSNDFVFEKVGPKDTHDLENGHRHHHGDVVNDLQTSTEGRDRYSTINSEDELLNGEPFLFENMTMDVKNDHADRGPDSECERVVTDRVDERTKDDGGAADVVDGGESKMEVKSDESVYRGTVDAAAASEPIPVPSSKKDSADKSIETSSETLVSENLFSSSSPRDINGFEKINAPSQPIDIPASSASKRSCENGVISLNSNHFAEQLNLSSSELSNSPLFSRTSSSNGWDNTLSSLQRQNTCQYVQYHLGEDGLIPLRSYIQERISKIIEEGKKKEEKLEKEIHTYRQVLINQWCLKCCGEKIDDNGSVIESVGSAGEGEASAVESLPSDKSWENLEYSMYSEMQGIKWVPDHAVTRCTNCNIKFWIGKRKHHCRKCGNIFCADCSENSTPLPSEQLYDPVRVCTGCYNKLQRDCTDMPSQCKQGSCAQTTSNQQIAASSN